MFCTPPVNLGHRGSIVAFPIINRLVPSAFQFEIRHLCSYCLNLNREGLGTSL